MKFKKGSALMIVAFVFLFSCEKEKGSVNVRFTIPPLKETGISWSYIPEGVVFKILLSCTADDIEPVVIEETIDYSDTTTAYEYTMNIPVGKARHFSAMIYAVGPDPTKHPKTYFLAGDAGFVDTEEPKLTVELNMLFLVQFGDSNIYIDSQDKVWLSITPLYQYTGDGIVKGLNPQQFQLGVQGGIGLFDGVQFSFISLDSFLSQRGLDFSQSGLYFTSMDGNDNTIFLGTSHGVFVFDIQSRQFVDFYDVETGKIPMQDPADDYVIQVMVKRFQQGAGSEVWFLMDGGIVVHNFISGTFAVAQGSQGNSYHFISEDPNSSVVFAGKYYDTTLGTDYNLSTFVWNSSASSWESGTVYLPDTEFLTLFTDSSGTKWLSAYDYSRSMEFLLLTSKPDFTPDASFDLVGSNGLSLNGINYPYFPFNISSINSYGNLFYLGSDAGLIIFDESLSEWNLLEQINSYLFDNYVRGIKITTYGDVWFTSGIFPTALPAGVKTGERTTNHPDNSRAVDSISITNNAMGIPYGIAITPDGQRIYAGWQEYPGGLGWIAEIDLSNKSVNQIPLNTNASPYFVRLSPDSTKLYASDSSGNRIWVIDLASKNVSQYPTNPPFGPFNFVVSSDGSKGYFLNDTSSPYGIKIIDLASTVGTEIANIQITDAQYVSDMEITLDESTAYVLGTDYSYNYKIYKNDIVNKTVAEFLVFLPDVYGNTFSPDRLLLDEKNNRLIASGLYVGVYQLAEIPLSDPLNYSLSFNIFPAYIYDMLLTPDSSLLFLTYNGTDYFHIFDAQDINTIRSESPFKNTNFSGGPMFTSPDGKTVYVVTQGPFTTGYPLNLESIR